MSLPFELLTFNQSVRWQANQYTASQIFNRKDSMMTATSIMSTGDKITLYGIVTDQSRVYVRDAFDFSLTNLILALESFDFEILAVMGFLLGFNILMIIISTCLDKSSFNEIK